VLIARRVQSETAAGGAAPRRAYLVAPAIAVAMLVTTLVAGGSYDLGLRDPDGVVGGRLVFVFALVALLWALDVVPRALRDARATSRPFGERLRAVIAERWSLRRIALVLGTIVAFYLTYLCYRNLKSYVPLARPELFDRDLLDLERSVFGGDPATFLHEVLGTGVSAHVLSTVYLLFLTFVPLSIALTLVWSRDLAMGLWWVAALSLNWVLGAASYFLIPALGPVYAVPELFAALPDTGAQALQETLLEHREEFLASPVAGGGLQSIAAFASLHVSIVLTGALMAQLLGAPRALRIGMWAFCALTALATIYLGWHYVIDDLAGVVIALLAVAIGGRLTGWRLERRSAQTQLALGSASLK
jgi:membrane-associated phospholipid phosphatase